MVMLPMASVGFGLQATSQVKEKDWPFRGPLAILELLQAVRSSGHEIGAYHDQWVTTSGVSAGSSAAHMHRGLMSVLLHLICFDQMDCLQSAGAEMLARRIMQIQRAVRKNPKAPEYGGLELMVFSRLESGGAAPVGDFAKFVAEEQKAEAFTMKQQRLFAEESGKNTRKKGE